MVLFSLYKICTKCSQIWLYYLLVIYINNRINTLYILCSVFVNWTSVTLRCPAPHDDITASAGVGFHLLPPHCPDITLSLLATPLHSFWLAGSTHLRSLIGDFFFPLATKCLSRVSRAPQRRQQTHGSTQSVCCLHVLILLHLTNRVLDEQRYKHCKHTKIIVCIFDCSI